MKINKHAQRVILIEDKPKQAVSVGKKNEKENRAEKFEPRHTIINGDYIPVSFEVYKKTINERKTYNKAESEWWKEMKLHYDDFDRKKVFGGKFSQRVLSAK